MSLFDDAPLRALGAVALLAFIVAVLGFGAALPGYLQGMHPVALLGARGIPHALVFNLLGFVLAGALSVLVAIGLLACMPADAGWLLRIGGQLMVLAGLAFVGLGLLPLDPLDLEGRASQYHASVWLLWVLAFVSGAVLKAIALFRLPDMRAWAWIALVAGLLVAVLSFGFSGVLRQAAAQRMALLVWLVWLAMVAWRWPLRVKAVLRAYLARLP